MSDDVLKFAGFLGDALITIYCVEGSPKYCERMWIESIKIKGKCVYYKPRKIRNIINRIKRGRVKVWIYLGGYCSNGDSWGPENTRWKFNKDSGVQFLSEL